MSTTKPMFIADSCIGGLSVVRSLWGAGRAGDAIFMADYAINPLGIKSDSAIADVARCWLTLAEKDSETLVIACNTLSIRFHQLFRSEAPRSALDSVVSMVDCFTSMVTVEAERLKEKAVLIVGTEFTARQSVYPDILAAALPGTRVTTVAATELERRIARLLPWDGSDTSVLSVDLRQAIGRADVVVLACTCFPMVLAQLENQFPGVIFLDPGAYCPNLVNARESSQDKRLSIRVTGDVVSSKRVTEIAQSYLGRDGIVS